MVNRRSTGLAALVLTGMVLAAGCSSSGSSGSTASTGPGGSAAPAGTLTIGSSAAPPSLDPTSSPSAAIDEVLDYNVYQHLVQLSPSGQVVPVLASGYAWSANRKTITFTIRQGVKFSNGDPLTAADVVYSIDRVVAKGSKYPYASLMGTLTSVKQTSPTTVAVALSQPDQEWLYQLAAYSNGVILDPNAVSKIAADPVGTGPYEYKSQVTNYSATLAANPDYWGSAPGFATVVFRYFTDPTAENSALLSGQIQLTLNNASGPLKNVLVRQAISYAINRQAILQTVGGGFGTVIGSDTVPGDPWYSSSYAMAYPYDPAKARQLLKEAGYPNGFSLTLTLPQP